MTRKDYEAIAAALAQAYRTCTNRDQQAAMYIVAEHVADVMARDNPRFDRARFLKAAGVQS